MDGTHLLVDELVDLERYPILDHDDVLGARDEPSIPFFPGPG